MLLLIIKQLLSWLFNKQQKLESQITQEYDAMTKEMRSMLSEVYENYAVNGELTYSEMSKYSRLDGLIKKIDKMTGESFKEIYEAMYGSLSDTFEEHFNRMAQGIEQAANQKVGYTPIKKDTIRKMILNPIDGLTLSDRLEKRRANVIFDIKQEMVQGLSNGETYDKVAKRLVSIFDGDKKKSYRVARTEMHRVSEQAKFSAALKAHENGVKMLKTWKSAHDYRVRDTTEASHVDLDGTTIPIDQNFQQGNGNGLCPGSMGSPDHDIFCRCILIFQVDQTDFTQKSETKSEEERKKKKEAKIKSDIKNGKYNLTFNKENYEKHVLNHKRYKEYVEKNIAKGKQKPSYLLITYEEAQGLIDEYAGTGKMKFRKNGEWDKKELITVDKIIGVHIHQETGKETPTKSFLIHYGKATHIIPTLTDKDD